MSPNYPSLYDNRLDCQVTIRFSDSPSVLIEFESTFNIESHSSCGWDYLEVRDGPSASSNVIGSKLCGDLDPVPTPIQSTGNSMTLIFHTDGSVTRSGFKIRATPGGYEILKCANSAKCVEIKIKQIIYDKIGIQLNIAISIV